MTSKVTDSRQMISSSAEQVKDAAPKPGAPRHVKRFSFAHANRVAVYAAIALIMVTSLAAWMEIGDSYSFLRRLASPRNFYGRIATWQTAARIALENPLAGVGLTNYSDYFDVIFSDWQHQDVDWVGDIRAIETPHSNFLWIAAELGVTGFAPYLLAHGYLLLMGMGAVKRAGNRQQLVAGGGLLALLAAYTIPGLTLQSGFYWDLNLYYFIMIGLLANIFSERPQ
jgi:O-antigen ligase